MAGMERQFRDAMTAPEPGPETPAEDASAGEEQDMTCPACGASAMKIVQAAQGGGAPMK